MRSEREWVRERFSVVRARLNDPSRKIYGGMREQLQREHRLLGKVLDEVPEGKVLRALEQWRRQFRAELTEHKKTSLPAQMHWYREWQSLPAQEKLWHAEPHYPELEIKIRDRSGYVWIIDPRFLELMDSVIERLKQWLHEEE